MLLRMLNAPYQSKREKCQSVVLQFRQMLNEELTVHRSETAADKGVSAYITQTFLGKMF